MSRVSSLLRDLNAIASPKSVFDDPNIDVFDTTISAIKGVWSSGTPLEDWTCFEDRIAPILRNLGGHEAESVYDDFSYACFCGGWHAALNTIAERLGVTLDGESICELIEKIKAQTTGAET